MSDSPALSATPEAHSPDLQCTICALDQQVEDLLRVDVQQAMQIAEKAVSMAADGDAYHVGLAYRCRAHTLRLLTRYSEASQNYACAVQQFESIGDHVEAARTRVGWIDALMYKGEYQLALELAERASRALGLTGDALAVAKLEMNVGNIYFHLDNAAQALRHYQSAVRAFSLLNDELHLAAGEANLGNALVQLDRFGTALRVLARARSRYVRLGLPLMVATLDLNIGYAWSCRGMHLKALGHLLRARHTFLEQDVPADVATTDLDIAQSYLALNLVTDAVEISREAGRIFTSQEMRREHGQALVYQAEALAELEPAEAEKLLCQAQEIFRSQGNRVWWATALLRLSYLVDQPEEAERLAERAAAIYSQLGLRRRALEGLLAQASAIERLGKSERADALYARVQKVANELGQPELLAQSLHARGRLNRSLPFFREAARLSETLRTALGVEGLRTGFASTLSALYAEMAELLADDGQLDELFSVLESARARALVDKVVAIRRRGQSVAKTDGTARLRRQILARQRRLREAEQIGEEQGIQRLHDEIARLERRLLQELREEEILKAAHSRNLATAAVISLDDVQAGLAPNEMLIEYFVAGDRVLALAIRSDRVDLFPQIDSATQVATLISKLRFQFNACARHGSDWVEHQGERFVATTRAYLQELHSRLLAPIDLGDAQRLLIVPHGCLHAVPFHALFDGQSYLLDQREICLSPSATLSFSLPAGAISEGPALVIGSPDRYAPLACEEAEAVARALSVRPYVGSRATRGAFHRHAPSASIIHVAAHATLRDDNPEFSSLHFADGALTAHEISQVSLNAELAVLSACATGVGAERPGDEIVSLARGFLAAGARRLAVSLWPVSDQVTARIMSNFYSRLTHAVPMAAMRETQRDARECNPHPYYWASFAIVGR